MPEPRLYIYDSVITITSGDKWFDCDPLVVQAGMTAHLANPETAGIVRHRRSGVGHGPGRAARPHVQCGHLFSTQDAIVVGVLRAKIQTQRPKTWSTMRVAFWIASVLHCACRIDIGTPSHGCSAVNHLIVPYHGLGQFMGKFGCVESTEASQLYNWKQPACHTTFAPKHQPNLLFGYISPLGSDGI